MKLKKFLTAVVGASLLTVGSVNAWAASGTVPVDGMTCTYTLNCSTSTAIATTKTVPANSSYISVYLEAYAKKGTATIVTTGSSNSYTGEMEVSTRVVSSTYGYPFYGARSTHTVNSWTGMLAK